MTTISAVRSLIRRVRSGPAAFGLLVLITWEVVGQFLLSRRVLPPITEIVLTGWQLIGQTFFWEAIWVTLQETLIGFVLGCSLGIISGIGLGAFRTLRRMFLPLVVGLEQLPRVALAPVFVAWFGFGLSSKIALAATLCFFPVVVNSLAAYDNYDEDRLTVLRALGAGRWQTLKAVRLPESLPIVLPALRVAMTFALIGAIVGEFVSGDQGLGPLILEFTFQFETARVFALVLILGLVGLLLYSIITFVEKRLTFWSQPGTVRVV